VLEDPLMEIILELLESRELKENRLYRTCDLVKLINEKAMEGEMKFRISNSRVLGDMIRERSEAVARTHNLRMEFSISGGYPAVRFMRLAVGQVRPDSEEQRC
jgi:hypothetical protein